MNFSLEVFHSPTDELNKIYKTVMQCLRETKVSLPQKQLLPPPQNWINPGNLRDPAQTSAHFMLPVQLCISPNLCTWTFRCLPFSLVGPFSPVVYVFANTFNCRGLNICVFSHNQLQLNFFSESLSRNAHIWKELQTDIRADQYAQNLPWSTSSNTSF